MMSMQKATEIDEITNNLKKISNSEVSFLQVLEWKFPDKFIFKPYSKQSGLILMKILNVPTGIVYFSVVNKNIRIEFIQGANNNKEIIKKNWSDIFIEKFILASSDLLFKKEYKLSLFFFSHLNLNSDSRKMLLKSFNQSKKEITELNQKINQIKLKLRLLKKKNKLSQDFLKKSLTEIKILNYELEIPKKSAQIDGLILKLYGGIRDKYFDKNGDLNFNKEKVKKIYKNYVLEKNKKRNIFTKKVIKLKEKAKRYAFKRK